MSLLVIVTALAAVVVGGAAGAKQDTRLNLVAYSTPKPVMSKIISAYQSTPGGSGVSFTQSYGGSTAQAQAVANGQPADLVFLSTGTDVNLLVDHGLVDRNYDKQSYKGVAANSVVVFAVRDGNPKKIKSWNDLLKPGVEVVTPNPFTAGIAKWNILAAYGAQRHLGKTDKQAIAFVKKLFDHVVSQDSSGSNATNTFLSGKGDVLITFESEAINARLAGRDIQYVIPRQTMLIELLVAVLKKSPSKDAATAFIRYMKSHPAQVLFGQNGFRPIEPAAAKQFQKQYPVRPGMFTINDKVIGGWRAVDKKWFNPTSSIMATIEKNLGVSTSGA
ncbi:MAG TPA: sulfate ABC transporter substrate-binding protein [Gaiella sp.]|jgi:sulfate transport system substrate-binding protein|nr:sulfate ABC transporter substrate-binding protein [Gaiella sp.]